MIYSICLATKARLFPVRIRPDKKPTPEERAYQFRTGMFQTFAWKMGRLVGAKMANDSAAFSKHATDLQNLTSMLEEGFQIENSLPDGTSAKPEIWEDFDKFEEKATTLRSAVAGLTEEGAMESFAPFQRKCSPAYRRWQHIT